MSAAGVVLILALCLSIYGSAMFETSPAIGVKTLTGRSIARDPLQSAKGYVMRFKLMSPGLCSCLTSQVHYVCPFLLHITHRTLQTLRLIRGTVKVFA